MSVIETKVFSISPLTGAVTYFHFDHATDEFFLETKIDLQHHLDHTKAIYNDARTDWKGDWHCVASIPMVLLPELQKQGIMSAGGRVLDEKKLVSWLNDRDQQWLRVRPGKV